MALGVLSWLGLATASPTHPQAAETFLRAAHWLDPVTGDLHGPVIVQIAGGKIMKLGAPREFQLGANATVTDLGAATLLPGLVDAHVHLQLGGGRPVDNALAILRAGFTTVVDLGATSDLVLRLRDRINAGTVEGPRVLAAGRWVGKQGSICEFGGLGIPGGPEAYRTRVGEDIAAGADVTKVCVSTWLVDAFERPDAYEVSDAALAATVDAAHRAGRLVIAHAISLGAVKASLRAGVDGLAHAAYVDQPTAVQLRDQNVFMIPTLASLVGDTAGPAAEGLRRAVATAHREKVRLVFGTDGGVLPHGQNAQEFAAMVAAGIPVLDAIRAATINAAQAFHLADEIGQIKAGYRADLIAVNGDPLRDTQVLSRVTFVMRDGRVISR
ncbi:MAG TPA: amidohydrolase family protein [Vicinamibacterales bacterium]|nr:amidohydrolase family protein [Vicinamibacterales bacterium]